MLDEIQRVEDWVSEAVCLIEKQVKLHQKL